MLGNLFTSRSFANGVIKLSVITVYAVSAYAFVMNSTTSDDELDLGLDNTTMGDFTGYNQEELLSASNFTNYLQLYNDTFSEMLFPSNLTDEIRNLWDRCNRTLDPEITFNFVNCIKNSLQWNIYNATEVSEDTEVVGDLKASDLSWS